MMKGATHRQGHLRTIVMVMAIAAAYFVTGRLGLLFAIPPGYATPVWPPSGIALAATLMYGYSVWPGIVLGSLLVNIGTAFEATTVVAMLRSVALATSIGLGAALQAIVAAYLVHRFVGFPNALNREKDIGAFLMLGGPVSCLVNATVGVTTLLVAGQIPWAMYFTSWWTWWVGDTIGVLIVTPLVLSWLAEPQQLWHRRRLSVALPLVGVFALTLIFFVYSSAQERERLELTFERQAEILAQTLRNSLEDYLDVLHSLESFLASAPEVDRHAFRTFVQRAFARYPGLQAVSLDLRVPDAQRATYEAAARREGDPAFQITEQTAHGEMIRAARRPEYLAVTYIEPYAGNEKALGYDMASRPDHLDALQQARDTGEPVATGRLTLVQETDRPFGWLVFLPIYGYGLPHATVEERRQSLHGYVKGVFWIGDMVEASLQGMEREGVTLRIEDEAAPVGQRLLYDSRRRAEEGTTPTLDDELGENPVGIHWDTTIEVAGRRWALRFAPTLEYLAARQSLQPWTVLMGGLQFTGLLGAFLLIVTGRATLIEQLVAERTAELTRANAALEHEMAERQQAERRFSSIAQAAIEAIISADSRGHILTWNHGARAIFGYTEEEVVGQPLSMLMPERYREAHQQALERIRAMAQPSLIGKVLELHGLRKDGREFPVELTLSTWTSAEGHFYGGIIRDITERKRVEEARARLAAIVESSDDAIISSTFEGAILSWNTGAERMYGYTSAEMAGQTIFILIPPDRLDETLGMRECVKQGKHIAHFETVGRRKDSTLMDISLALSPLHDAAGKIIGASAIARDITERKRAEEELRRTAAELARSNTELEQFAHVASHDLQEPLRAVAGCVQLLQLYYQDRLDGRAHELIAHAADGAIRMQTLINDLFAYSRASTRGNPFAPTECAAVLQAVLANLSIAIQESGAVITHDPLPTVLADATQLLQVFQNLLSNAIKFRGEQPPAIHIDVERQDGEWVFAVRDNGIGIEPQYFERIFRVFQRLHTRREYPGTGIGLAICKKIVERHSGRIWVTSEFGKGSTFFFTLPDQR